MCPSKNNEQSTQPAEQGFTERSIFTQSGFLVPVIVSVLVVIVAALFLFNALIENGGFCFPLDDPWIHLTFARNLCEQFRFFYVKDGPSIQASTSPLYTIALTPAFIAGLNEYLFSYFWGVCGVLILVWAFHFCVIRIAPALPGWTTWAGVAALIALALDRRIIWVSLSGMETTCFIALIFTARALLSEKKYAVHALSLALIACWLRPEGAIFAAIVVAMLALDYLWLRTSETTEKQTKFSLSDVTGYFQASFRSTRILFAAGVLGMIAYFTLNLVYNGSPWPSTMSAKVTGFKAIGNPDYFIQVLDYLSYAGIILLLPGLIWAVIETGFRLWRRQSVPVLIDILWCVSLIVLYYWKLPYVRQHGRYILPVLPFLVLAGLYGTTILIARFSGTNTKARAVVLHGLLALIVIWQVSKINDGMVMYAQQCNYYLNRHVAAAEWVRDETPADAIIGTHDIGAMGFIADRKLVDMAGLVDPEVVPHLHDNAFIKHWLMKRQADYVAILNTWYTVINVNPLAVFAPDLGEVLSIFPLTPRLKFMEKDLIYHFFDANTMARQRQFDKALQTLEQLLYYEPQFAAGYTLRAKVLIVLERFDEAEKSLEHALRYQPDNAEAHYQYALLEYQRGNLQSTTDHLDKTLDFNPHHFGAIDLAEKIQGIDSVNPH